MKITQWHAGEKVWLYDATDMLAALCAHGLVEAKFEDGMPLPKVSA